MSIYKAIISYTIEKSAEVIAKGSSEILYKQAQESGHKLYLWVGLQPYKRFKTAIVATSRFLFLPVIVFILVPLPIFILSERALLFEDYEMFIVDYFSSFAIIYIFLSLFTPVVFLGSLMKNPHEKRSGLGANVNKVISEATKSSLIVEPLQVTGMTAFKWDSVERLVRDSDENVAVIFIQPKHRFRKLFTYPGIWLAFSSDTDADDFYVTGNKYLENLEQNTKKAKASLPRRLSSNGL